VVEGKRYQIIQFSNFQILDRCYSQKEPNIGKRRKGGSGK
jgi:hypothetical protein